ncbi:MAG: type II toxin-antitoxin system RelE/ParE family toxin [Thermodesulfobacteriota bacterium]
MLRLDLTRQARRFLETLPPKQFRQVVNKVFSLMSNPDAIQMQGYPYRRSDIGEYRIVYRVESDTLKVACIGKRNDEEVYRLLRGKHPQ